MISGYSFRPRAWAFALAVAGCAAGIALGNWQAGRAAEKRAAAVAEKRLQLRGEFLERYTVLLDNKVFRGRVGYHVVQPLKLADGRHVLVNRGWIAAPAHRERLPQIRTPAGAHEVEGRVLEHFPRAYDPTDAPPSGRVWQNVELTTFAAWSGLRLEPYVLEQHSPFPDGLTRNWPPPDSGADKNESYALQWYTLAALAVVLFLVLSVRRAPPAV
ncbi:MAG TPA: SURF1 family protein [Burkholderiales bacterium]|nr:SURF1 family protein [Burkholderiales bacterium]